MTDPGQPADGQTGDETTPGGAHTRRTFIKGAAAIAGVAASAPLLQALAAAADSPIVAENQLAGTNDWDLTSIDDTIEGFTTEYSVNAGETLRFKIKTPSTNYRIDIYRIGYYGGLGGRKVATINPSVPLPQSQPNPNRDTFLGLTDCGNWGVTASWAVPANAVSGVYVANLIRLDASWSRPDIGNRIVFVVRNDGRQSAILVQTSDTTSQAYNRWGGDSLYVTTNGANWGRAVKVSYNRPMEAGELENEFFYSELPLVRWLERNGYDVAYFSGIDTDRRPAEILKHKVFISSGHDEYVSGAARANVEAARNAGVHLIFMTGNEYFWKTRWEADAAGTSHRTLVCYKETLEDAKTDPSSEWTGTWRDPRFSPPSNGGRPENALTGSLFKAINPLEDNDFAIKVPYEYSRLRFWRNTSVATIAPGATATLANATLGYEWDTDGDFPSRPPGLIRLSQTTETATQVLQDYGKTYVTQPLTHYVSMYRHSSGSLVWATGTVQWSWGLDDYHTNRPDFTVPQDVRMQQATVNVLADMGVQPATRQSNLVVASPSTDTIPPSSTITTPAAGTTVPVGSPVTISGTATDSGGGRVAGVEISLDNGQTWHPAVGTTAWTYSFTPMALGPLTIRTRATDDSCNIETPSAGRGIIAGPRALPGSLWNGNVIPDTPAVNDNSALELGLRFQASIAGFATGVRFYKGTGNTGTHVGRLWSATGALLANVTFANETATGWQTAQFAQPVALDANTTYVVSYSAPVGHYAATANYFASAYELPPLKALPNNQDGPNGVYNTTPGQYPQATYGASNYWVNVIFDTDDHRAPTGANPCPAAGVGSVAIAAKVAIGFSEAMQANTVQFGLADLAGAAVPGGGAYVPDTRTYTFTPASNLGDLKEYRATVSGSDLSGQAMAAPFSWTFTTTGPPGTTPTSVWTSADVPATASANEATPIELGMKFRATVNGLITGIRFYKGPANTGTHIGRLWDQSGAMLGSVTFANESATGWQQANFATPVAITANTTYVVSYYAPQGGYSVSSGFFGSSDVVRGPLRALAATTPGRNGVYRYGAGGGFPSASYNDTNYWVNVMFDRAVDLAPPALEDRAPAPALQGVHAGSAVTAVFDKDIVPSSLAFTLKTTAGANVAGTASYDGPTRTATFQPSGSLSAGTKYTASVLATATGGGAMASPVTWSFTVATAVGQVPATIWDTSAVPAVVAANDPAPIEVGVKFSADVAGVITGIRFYKGAGNTGTHVGRLWTSTGTLLGSAVFNAETASGWQQVDFAAPIEVAAGQTYVASYYAPAGRYAYTGGGLGSVVTRSPLRALASGSSGGNGVYAYGSGAFPTGTYGSSNYWVDVVFQDAGGPTITDRSPAPGTTGVDPAITPSVTFSEGVQPATVDFRLQDSGGGAVAGAVAYDANTMTATFSPSAPLGAGATYTASVRGARDVFGNQMGDPVIWSFTTSGAQGVSLFGNQTPATPAANDPSAVEVGLRFRTTQSGSALGVRFFKGPGNTGTHVGNLWSTAGALLATVTFSGESSLGWQYAAFSSPVPLTAGETYVVSYHAPQGRYAVNGGFFAAGDVVNGPLVGVRNATGSFNGVYRYGSGGVFPTGSYNAANYWVNILFASSGS